MAMTDINDTKRWEEFYKKLIIKTGSGEIEWQEWSDRIHRPDSRSPLYVAKYKEWHILLYKFAYKYFIDDEHFDWQEDVAMEIVGKDGVTEWLFPKTPSRYRLLDLVQFRSAGVENLLNDVLGEGVA